MMVRAIAGIFDLEFHRIQFTPDLMPADITGTEILTAGEHGRELRFVKGPVFTNVLLADEINRTPPKTQAALLEAMQEKQVTVGGTSRELPKPFFVLATQNPIEMEGTYPLPEAQLDRFMLNVFIDYLPEEDEVRVVSETTRRDDVQLNPVFSAEEVVRIQGVVRKVPVADSVVRYAVRLAASSRPGQKGTPDFVNEWVNWGAGLRAGQALILGSKARALLQGRSHVTPDDVKALAVPVLRHRILPNFKAEAEGVDADKVVEKLLETVRVP
ncbi:MAG: MoxR family ATPase, partial [Verrucomicrobia bacterium]|nr:MoxR family ATPase [Verrucomicrobiota bacterium]